jgi:glycosyltransferase involved in cell wall biosynthesis
MNRPTIVQFNLSPTLGGAEVYTAFFSRALAARGWPTRMVVNAAARFWDDLDLGCIPRASAATGGDGTRKRDIAVIHSPVPAGMLSTLARHYVAGVAHQAIYSGKHPAYYDRADMLLAVSRHVMATLQQHGLARVHPTPLYGVADLDRGAHAAAPAPGPLFDVDARKPRDRLLAAIDRARTKLAAPRRYERRPGLTLGVVSRLAPLKQFPALFEHLVPILVRHPGVNLELFGAAVGYKSLAEVRRAVAPLGERVRFWGHQRDVASAYRALDYLLTGLPEREALGLNAIESCVAGTPVLAIAAPPFSETMKDGVTGFLYTDPRRDGGRDFERVLIGIESGALRPDLAAAALHLQAFSFERFADRVDAVIETLAVSAARQETD